MNNDDPRYPLSSQEPHQEFPLSPTEYQQPQQMPIYDYQPNPGGNPPQKNQSGWVITSIIIVAVVIITLFAGIVYFWPASTTEDPVPSPSNPTEESRVLQPVSGEPTIRKVQDLKMPEGETIIGFDDVEPYVGTVNADRTLIQIYRLTDSGYEKVGNPIKEVAAAVLHNGKIYAAIRPDKVFIIDIKTQQRTQVEAPADPRLLFREPRLSSGYMVFHEKDKFIIVDEDFHQLYDIPAGLTDKIELSKNYLALYKNVTAASNDGAVVYNLSDGKEIKNFPEGGTLVCDDGFIHLEDNNIDFYDKTGKKKYTLTDETIFPHLSVQNSDLETVYQTLRELYDRVDKADYSDDEKLRHAVALMGFIDNQFYETLFEDSQLIINNKYTQDLETHAFEYVYFTHSPIIAIRCSDRYELLDINNQDAPKVTIKEKGIDRLMNAGPYFLYITGRDYSSVEVYKAG